MEKIDAVITWVDGSEPNYKLKLEENLKNKKIINRQYLQANEIHFCVASIIKFAPFVRKIFIVTDNQKPNLNEVRHFVSLNKVEIIDHKEIFRDNMDFLPTFNIRSIDALLFKIKNLSNKFIYFNDDMFLIKETSEEEWFKNIFVTGPGWQMAQKFVENVFESHVDWIELINNDDNYKNIFPPIEICGDNAAMIAMVGLEKYKLKQYDKLDYPAKPRWPLDEKKPPMLGGGKRGAKA